MIVSASPSAASAADGDELGTVIAAWGDPERAPRGRGRAARPHLRLHAAPRRRRRRRPAATVAEWLDLPYDAGAPMERTDEPAPLDLYERYLQQRRLAVPAAAVSWGVMLLVGLAGVVALALRRRVSPAVLGVVGALTTALPWLAIGLLLVGHLPSLTAATVIAFLVVFVGAGVVFTRWVASRRGDLRRVRGLGRGRSSCSSPSRPRSAGRPPSRRSPAGDSSTVAASSGCRTSRSASCSGRRCSSRTASASGPASSSWPSARSWPARRGPARTSARRSRSSPPPGLWLAIRRRRPWWLVVLITGAITAIGMAAIAVMHRYLTDADPRDGLPREHTSLTGVLDRLTGRLGIGGSRSPTPRWRRSRSWACWSCSSSSSGRRLRSPRASRGTTRGGTRSSSSSWLVVAYLANDTGAAAVGFGFGFALSGLLGVSLAVARGKMKR